jgi:RNA polymerase sigma factor (sigma-70 family)
VFQIAQEDFIGTEQLVSFLGNQAQEAFAAIFARYQPRVLAVCRYRLQHWHDAENACQRAFIEASRKASCFRTDARLGEWLCGIAVRVCQNIQKSNRRRQFREARYGRRKAPQLARPADEAEYHELLELVETEARHLPTKFRRPVILCCLEGKSKAEAAAELGWKEGTLSCRLARGRARLQRALRRRGIVPPWERPHSGRE